VIGQRGGQVFVVFLVFGTAALDGARALATVTALVGAAWLIALVIVRRAYVEQFRDMLQAATVRRDVRVPDLDRDALDLLGASLASPDEIEALAALDLLARRGGRIPPLVLYHPRQRVVRRALALLGHLGPDAVRPLAHLIDHPDPEIRADALAASGHFGWHRDRLAAALADDHPGVRAAALVGLIDEPRHRDAARAGVVAMAAGTVEEQAALAHAIGYAADPRFRPILEILAARPEPAVLREVLKVYARRPGLANLERLVALLHDPHLRRDVRRVFLAAGSRGLARAIDALDDPRTPLTVRQHLPRTISRFRTRAAAAALVARLPHEPDPITEYKILRALGRMRADDPSLPVDAGIVRGYARRAVEEAARFATLFDYLCAELEPSSSSSGSMLLVELLAEQRRGALERSFRALAILYPRADLRSVYDGILSDDDARWTAAREIIDHQIPLDLRRPLLAVIDDLTPEQRRAQLGALAAGPFPTYEDFLAALLADHRPRSGLRAATHPDRLGIDQPPAVLCSAAAPDRLGIDDGALLRCIVAHHVAERRLQALRPELVRLRTLGGSPYVIHAFDQAIARLDA